MQNAPASRNGRRPERAGASPMQNLVRAIRRRWLLATAVPVLILLATAAFLATTPRVYEATARLRIEENRSSIAVLDALKSLSQGSQMETEMEVLRSRTLAEQVVDSLGLQLQVLRPRDVARSELLSSVWVSRAAPRGEYVLRIEDDGTVEVATTRGPGEVRRFSMSGPIEFGGVRLMLRPEAAAHGTLRLSVARFPDAVRTLQRRSEITRPNREASIARIRYTSTDSVLVRDVVNTMAAGFIELRQLEQNADARGLVGFLDIQIDTLNSQLVLAEEVLRDYQQRVGIASAAMQAEAHVKHLADMQAQRDLLESERAALAQLIVAPGPGGETGARRLVGFHSLLRSAAASELLRSLTDAENRRAALLETRTPEDPDVVSQSVRIAEMETQLRSIADSYHQGLANQIAEVDGVLRRFSSQLSEIPEREIQVARLRRQSTVLADIYTLLQTRRKEAEIAAAVEDNSVRIVDPAVLPTRPIRPNKPVSLAFAVVLGMTLGLGGAVLRDLSDRSIHTKADLQAIIGTSPVLGQIPRIQEERTGSAATRRQERLQPRLIAGHDLRNPITEAYRRLRTNLSFARPGATPRVLVFTSPLPGEGKSTSAANLALTLAQQQRRCVLIDADMRRGLLHEAFHVPSRPGLADLLIDRSGLDDVIRIVPLPSGDELHLIAGGSEPPNPAELIASDRMESVLKELAERYETIIIDAPPLNLVTDAALLGAKTDGVVLVVRAGMTRDEALEHALEQLDIVHAELIGVVLNDVTKASGYAAYESYYGRRGE